MGTPTDYHSIDRMSQSKLKLVWSDPSLFYQLHIAKSRPLPLPTPSMQFGQDCETYLFNNCFPDAALIPPDVLNADGHRKGKAWSEFAAANSGKRLLKQSEWDALHEPFIAIKKNVMDCGEACKLVFGGQRKVPILWSYLGVEMKSEIDVLHENCIVDIKTCADVTPEGFSRQAASLSYNVQAAAYQIAVEQHTGKMLPFVFVAIHNKPSYRVECYRLSEKFMQLGRELLGDMIEFYKTCQETGEWRTETWGRVMEIDPPSFYERQMEAWSESAA